MHRDAAATAHRLRTRRVGVAGSTARTNPAVLLGILFAAGLFGVCLVAPRSAAARETDPFKRNQVLALITSPDSRPSLEDWKRVGPEANRVLVELAEDPELRPSLRLRAMAHLAWFPSRRTQAFLTRRMYGRDVPAIEKRVALRAFALAFGREAFQDLRGFLTDADPAVREGAIRALGFVRGRRVQTLLENHLVIEQDLRLKQVTEEVLATLRGPRPKGRPPIEPEEEPAVPAPATRR